MVRISKILESVSVGMFRSNGSVSVYAVSVALQLFMKVYKKCW